MTNPQLDEVTERCRALIQQRFPEQEAGAAAMLLSDGTILVGTAPEAINPAVEVCHETEPYCAAHRLDQKIVASICLYRDETGAYLVLAPCGVCQERLATHGPDVLAAVPATVSGVARWVPLKDLMPHYWVTAFDDAPPEWSSAVATS